LFDFLKKNQNEEAFRQIVNAKSTLGQTFLDYLKFRYDSDKRRDLLPAIEEKYIAIFKFVCSKGGEFSYYKDVNCLNF
jgi:hypothetical protein